MRLAALCAGIAVALFAAGSAQAGCLKADASGQVAEGRLDSVRITIDAYRLKEQAYILRLRSPVCLEGDDEYDKIKRTERIHVFATDETLRRQLRSFVGRVRVIGSPFGEHTAHHHAPIVLRISRIDPVARR